MKITIHRGQNQIGGTIIEISTDTTRILLDIGLELNDDGNRELPLIEGLFDNAEFDAVFISHYYVDHLGLAYYIDKRIPLYIGEAAYHIVKATDNYKGVETVAPAGFIKHREPIIVGDITVTPYLCDHSAFDSYMLLCESGGERILYSGDFRSHGRKNFDWLLNALPDKVNTLICEGTTLSREDYAPITEADLENKAAELFRGTEGPVFVMQSSSNIDRIVTIYRAAKKSSRIFLEELYMAEITSAVGGSIPNPGFNDVYAFDASSKRYETLSKHKNRISKAQMAKRPFVMCVRSSMLPYLQRLSEQVPFADGVLVYSMWSGYREQAAMQDFLDGCEKLRLKIVALHTGGHADADTIKRLIDAVSPDEILPVHTELPEWFAELEF